MERPLPTQLAPPSTVDWSQVTAPSPGSGVSSFGTGYLIARTFTTWGRHVLHFAPLGLLGGAPMAVGSYLLYSSMPGLVEGQASPSFDRFLAVMGAFGVAWLVTMLLLPLLMGAVAHGAIQALRGERPRLGAMLAAGGRGYLRLLAMGLLVTLAMIPASLLLVVPAIILLVGWSVAIPAVVAEGLGPIRALSRSWALTRGHRWRVFAGFLVASIAVAMVAGLFQGVTFAALLATHGPRGMGPGPALAVPMTVYQLVLGALNTVLQVAMAVAYHGLRTAKEGGDPVQLARVFE
jgi:hypothetical protein